MSAEKHGLVHGERHGCLHRGGVRSPPDLEGAAALHRSCGLPRVSYGGHAPAIDGVHIAPSKLQARQTVSVSDQHQHQQQQKATLLPVRAWHR